jgi:hypothetical protein
MRMCNQNLSIPEGLNQEEPKRSKSETLFPRRLEQQGGHLSTCADAHVNTIVYP